MKNHIKLLFVSFLLILITLTTACVKQKSFEEACEGLKQEILNRNYLCNCKISTVYERPVFMIEIVIKSSDISVEGAENLSGIFFARIESELLPYIEENFSHFENESIFLGITFNGRTYERGCGYIYGYYS